MSNLKPKEKLIEIATFWAHSQIDSWLPELSAWDDVVEDEGLSDEDLKWIQENVQFTILVREKQASTSRCNG